MVIQILGLVFCVCFLPISYGIKEKENNEAICYKYACYTVHLNNKTFTDAHMECTNRTGTLLTIHNEEEAGQVYSLLWKFTNTRNITFPLKLWIGLQLKIRSCVHKNETLKGFSWITGAQQTQKGQFSNWLTDPIGTCIKERCVSMNLQKDSPDNYKWTDEPCSSPAGGYLCKFHTYGMCQRVALSGPGYVEYETPFKFRSSSLDFVPYGTSASVSCGHNGEHTGPSLFCLTTNESNVYQWFNSELEQKSKGPFCASEKLGCKYNNGGCEHECVEYPQNRSLSCRCRDGYVLAPNLVSCVYPDHCKSNPCGQKCISHQYGFECSCSGGSVLAKNKVDCITIERCLKGECDPRDANGYRNEDVKSEYNDTSISIQREHEPQTTSHSITEIEKNKGNTPRITHSTTMPSVKTVFFSASPVNDAFDCSDLLRGSKLLLGILCICTVFYY